MTVSIKMTIFTSWCFQFKIWFVETNKVLSAHLLYLHIFLCHLMDCGNITGRTKIYPPFQYICCGFVKMLSGILTQPPVYEYSSIWHYFYIICIFAATDSGWKAGITGIVFLSPSTLGCKLRILLIVDSVISSKQIRLAKSLSLWQ